MEEKIVQNTITINASADKIWDALVNPEKTKRYMYGCETVSDWKIGSDLLWRGTYNGQEMVFVKGSIIELIQNKKLVYSTFDPMSSMEDKPENYLHVTYDLVEENNKTLLTVTQGDYNKVADGEKRYQDSYNNGIGWQPILDEIKKLVESLSNYNCE